MEKQTTIKREVKYSGIGLHTGNSSTITFKPALENTGYIFVRTDIEKEVEIPALVENVVDLARGTTLGIDDVKVHTVEHVLAALAGLQIDNCRIELTANEPPAVDGSAMPYVEALLDAGIEELEAEREYFVLDETIGYKDEERQIDIVALPTDDFRITVMIDYFNPALGSQHTGLFDLKKEFVKEFAPARTFCFLKEVEMLYDNDLIRGGSLESAVVIVDRDSTEEEREKIKEVFKLDRVPKVGPFGSILDDVELRYPNEPARHKLLDMIGDLALVGVPIKAQVLAARPGHAANYEFSKIIRKKYLEFKEKEKYMPSKNGFVFDVIDIMGMLPHRYPFLLVDRVMNIDPETRTIRCLKNVTMNEPYFQGHFPNKPIMPGVLQLEGMAQAGGILIKNILPPEKVDNKLAFFMSIDKVKFRKPVVPGDTIIYEVTLTKEKFNINYFDCRAYVGGEVVSQCNLSAALMEKDY